MKYAHAKHVIHMYDKLNEDLTVAEAQQRIASKALEAEMASPEVCKKNAKDCADDISNIDSEIAALQDQREIFVKHQQSLESQIANAGTQIKAAGAKLNEFVRLVHQIAKKQKPYALELDAAKARVAEILAAEQEKAAAKGRIEQAVMSRLTREKVETPNTSDVSRVASELLKKCKSEAAAVKYIEKDARIEVTDS